KGVAYLKDGKNNEAVIELRNALQIDPKFAPALHALGRAYKAKGWHFDAARELQRVVEIEPDLAAARIDLGQTSLVLEAWDEAIKQGEAPPPKAPDAPSALYLIGAAKVGKGQTTEGLELLTRAARLAPTAPEIQAALGNALARVGRLGDAERGCGGGVG